MPDAQELVALSYLAVVLTAVAFVLWYAAVNALEATRAGLYTGIAPISTIAIAALVGTGSPTWFDLLGGVVVATGVIYGMADTATGTNRVPAALGTGARR